MDTIGRQSVWNRIREKMEKGEKIGSEDIVWGILLNGGFSTKDVFLGENIVKNMELSLENHKNIISKEDSELKSLYQKEYAVGKPKKRIFLRYQFRGD